MFEYGFLNKTAIYPVFLIDFSYFCNF